MPRPLIEANDAATIAAALGLTIEQVMFPRISGGDGTDDDDPPGPDDDPNGNVTPPTRTVVQRTPTPQQRFSQADLDAAASSARSAENARLTERHRRAIETKDAEIQRLTDEITRLGDVIEEYDKETDAEVQQLLENLPPALRRFAPPANASGLEKRRFLNEARLSAAEIAGTPPTDDQPPATPPVVPPASPPRVPRGGSQRPASPNDQLTDEERTARIEREKRARLGNRRL